MSHLYLIDANGFTHPMHRLRIRDEITDLQQLLHHNPQLLAGEQINPDDPRRWLLIRREMPVPDPVLGADRWNIDFVYADQSATLTFVECKRYKDSRSRRAVVGQMLE